MTVELFAPAGLVTWSPLIALLSCMALAALLCLSPAAVGAPDCDTGLELCAAAVRLKASAIMVKAAGLFIIRLDADYRSTPRLSKTTTTGDTEYIGKFSKTPEAFLRGFRALPGQSC
jgi:hypothetical protein